MEINKYCKRCAQHPELCHTGQSPGNPQWYCIVCKTEYYQDKDGKLLIDRPFSWPVGAKGNTETWQIKKGHWTKTA